MAGGHHVSGLLVVAVTDLYIQPNIRKQLSTTVPREDTDLQLKVPSSYLGHSSLTAEASADTAVDTLRLAP